MKWKVIVTAAVAFVLFACVPALAKLNLDTPIYEPESGRWPSVDIIDRRDDSLGAGLRGRRDTDARGSAS